MIGDKSVPNWRDDESLVARPVYKRRWALTPVVCSCGVKIWFNHYYSKYLLWTSKSADDPETAENSHKDFIENITEAEYIVRKLAENL